MKKVFAGLMVAALVAGSASAAMQVVVSEGIGNGALAAAPSATDLIAGKIATELPGDLGWHPANTAPADQLPAFTDGTVPGGLHGLLNDFPGAGNPAKRVQYDFSVPSRVDGINVFSGNDGGDGRIFHTYTVEFSLDGGSNWTTPLYVQSHASGTLNNAANNGYTRVLSELTDDAGPLAVGATNARFDFYSVDNTGGEMRDAYDGVNPFTTADDGLSAAIASPLIMEIDVLGVPEPATMALLGVSGLAGLLRLRRRR